MATIPSITSFVSFVDLSTERNSDNNCIYHLNKEGRRCKYKPLTEDRIKASELRKVIETTNGEVSIALLQSYASLNCCQRYHQTRLADFGLLEPLASKWQQELRRRTTPPKVMSALAPRSTSSRGISKDGEEDLGNNEASCPPPRYILRPRLTTQALSLPVKDATESTLKCGFRPYIAGPSQAVSSALRKPLTRQEHKIGKLYLYSRASSPGFVKVGLTTKSVEERLAAWQSQCGYEPQLIASFEHIPHIHRVEKLVHYELAAMSCRRREIRCPNPNCSRQHTEWFEVDRKIAVSIAAKWTSFMMTAAPYDQDGNLKMMWADILERRDWMNKPINAQALLRVYHASIGSSVDSPRAKRHTTETEHVHGSACSTIPSHAQSNMPLSTEPVQGGLAMGTDRLANLDTLAIMESRDSLIVKNLVKAILDLTRDQQTFLAAELGRKSGTGLQTTRKWSHDLSFSCTRLGRQNTNVTVSIQA